ncbi:UNVERIFIED_ORG: glycine/D-amino acid oxidase-like deaminating enzyme [Pseudomonas fluorescens]|jgi:glycine/D-amino acid oxidase-like deaminating enzyme|uniref:NAD(P)/FAD-dependent oxidoreductase n=1 Tax=Pseudomonas TaxID=286 RepID=UPI000A1DE527|nr:MULTISPECIES: FAD-dependent oxidoreductase [unclassified Pseudomonas]MDP9712893.1 glycine/D-amino acid oxidase-like deaminating enzyme [Pseudomonas fluorescens]QZD69683.1 FAD-binding oxidoreductase [Pseudomonas sp. 3-2]
MSTTNMQDAVVVGGGFYGAAIAVYLARQRGMKQVMLIERESSLLSRASYNNQARVHNGYHYPRSFTTAYRSRVNLPKFVQDWPEAVKQDFTKLYAIARRNSKVTANQFERFYREIGAKIELASPALRSLFEPRLIEEVFLVEEYAFDSTQLARWAIRELQESGVRIRLNTQAVAIANSPNQSLNITLAPDGKDREQISARYVFNCTYSGLNQFGGDFPGTRTALKQEITEMALMRMPPALSDLGITVMDGPFFSVMPFPARGLHTVSHVRYTPHLHWADDPNTNPYQKLDTYQRDTRVDRMIRDIGRYLPSVLGSEYVDSLFEVKTILSKNEGDDGRPILFEKHETLPGCYSILGGKIDNIYDVLEKLETENLSGTQTTSSEQAQ